MLGFFLFRIFDPMKINEFLDATYLKTAIQANISEEENRQKVVDLINEAILYNYKLVMIRAKYISLAKEMLLKANTGVLIGTVIDFPEGNSSKEIKLEEAKKAITLGADELDFVVNYNAFKEGKINLIKAEVFSATKFCIENNKVAKWIIEVAALTAEEIIVISQLIKGVVLENFDEMLSNSLIKIFTTKMGISSSSDNLEYTVINSEEGNIESSTTKIEDDNVLLS
jgi:deoxyribose-phosphate aldolase